MRRDEEGERDDEDGDDGRVLGARVEERPERLVGTNGVMRGVEMAEHLRSTR